MDMRPWIEGDLAERVSHERVRIPEREILVRVAMRPAIHGNAIDVARSIKAPGAKDSL